MVTELVEQCQALCAECHRNKTAAEQAAKPKAYTHGTIYAWMQVKCTCSVCAEAKRAWHNERNERRRTGRPPGRPRNTGL